MRSIGGWLRTRPARLHVLIVALITTNVVALFAFPWLVGLVLQIASLLEVLFFVHAYRHVGIR
jgi:hypothetical protein